MAEHQAGWYPDPAGDASRLRYWDGTQWTSNFTDVPSPSSSAQPVQTVQPLQATPSNIKSPAATKNNVLAIISLVCSLVGLFIPLVTSVAAIILGAIALRNPVQRSMAIAGIIMGVLFMLGWIVTLVLMDNYINLILEGAYEG